MVDDFFLGFAGHAHTMNELELDHQRELELRRRNSPEEVQKLTGMILDKLEKDLSGSGYGLDDVKLLVLYSSYRGEPAEKDTLICGSILKAIENRFKKHDVSQLRLIGHTTGGELENEDLVLKRARARYRTIDFTPQNPNLRTRYKRDLYKNYYTNQRALASMRLENDFIPRRPSYSSPSPAAQLRRNSRTKVSEWARRT